MAYYINHLESEVSGRGREGPPITQYPYYTKNLGKVWDIPQDVSDEIFFSRIGIVKGAYFVKYVPNFQVDGPSSATHKSLTIKVVYLVNHSWYG